MTFRRSSWLPAIGFQLALCCSFLLTPILSNAETREDIQLLIRPRVCTLSRHVKTCHIPVEATWRSDRPESLCLIILQHADVKECWENYRSGAYTVQLTFADDLTFQLRDTQLRAVLASQMLRVIREAIQYRQRRREVWDIFG